MAAMQAVSCGEPVSGWWRSLLAFGIGILRVARRRSVRWIGWLLVAGFFIIGLWNHTIWAMSSRDLETGFNDTMHITLTMVFTLLVVAVMVLSAVADRGLEESDTPWAGGFERINAYAYSAWLVVLAVTVMRHELGATRPSGERDDARDGVPIAA